MEVLWSLWLCPAYGWGRPGYFADKRPDKCLAQSRQEHRPDCQFVQIIPHTMGIEDVAYPREW